MSRAGISGIGVVSALGENAAETRRNLFASAPVRLPAPPRRIETKLDLPVFEIPVPEVDPADEVLKLPIRFLLHALAEALTAARITPEELRARRVGIAVGTTVACQLDDIPCYTRLRQNDFSEPAQVLRYVTGLPAEYLRRRLGATGPALTVSNACSSGSDAVMIALEWLRTDRCDLAIACGCDSVSKVAFNGFNALRVCSAKPCRPFDADRAGLNLGDAAGVLILEDPDRARERGLEPAYEIGGAGKTADAYHITAPEESGGELERAVRLALEQAGMTPADMEFVNAHGTGTLVNDRVEGAALARIFGPALRYQSTKALTGHTLGAAGAIEAAFTEFMLESRRAAASFRFAHPSPEIPVTPLASPAEIAGNAALSTSLAFGGSNTALVVRRCRPAVAKERSDKLFIAGFASLPPGAPDRPELAALCRKYGLRRPDRLTQLMLAAAERLNEKLGGASEDTALLTVSAYGPGTTVCRVLDDILDYPEEEILPTGFSHSVVNAAASYLGSSFGLHGPTFALVGFEDPFFEAADLARTLIADGVCRRALIVAADEESITSVAAERLRKSPTPRAAEGAFALLVGGEAADALGELQLDDRAAEQPRMLPCGVPETFAEKLLSGSTGPVALTRLLAPDWRA